MTYWNSEFDMTLSFSANSRQSHLNSTAITYYTFMLNSFVLSTSAFPIFSWTKNSLTEEPSFLWFKCSIIYSFWIFYLTITPTANSIGSSNSDIYLIETRFFSISSKKLLDIGLNAHDF